MLNTIQLVPNMGHERVENSFDMSICVLKREVLGYSVAQAAGVV